IVTMRLFVLKPVSFFLLLIAASAAAVAQSKDESSIKQLFDVELKNGQCYKALEYLTTKIGARLSGSPGAAAAVEWSRHEMEGYTDSVFLQPVMVPHWVRGQKEIGRVLNARKKGIVEMNVCALGMAVGTGPSGVTGNVVEVRTFDELRQLGEKN